MFKNKSELAFLGTAWLNISPQNEMVDLKFGTYNPGRQTQEDLVRFMAEKMNLGECNSESNPLVIAVEAAKTSSESLVTGPSDRNQPSAFRQVEFNTRTSVPLELLAGMHRVKAARLASGYLTLRLKKLKRTIDKPRKHSKEQIEDQLIDAIKEEIAAVTRTIELVERWPVRFYDIGGVQSHPPNHLESRLT